MKLNQDLAASGLVGDGGIFLASRRIFHHGALSSCPTTRVILVTGPGIKPTSPALQNRFLTIGLPGKSFPIYSFLGAVRKTKEMRPQTQPAMVVNESNAPINRSMCVNVWEP